MARILILCPYPKGGAPSQRFRFEQYLAAMAAAGHTVVVAPFLPAFAHRVIYRKGYFLQKVVGVLLGFLSRILLMASLRRYDYVFVHREASPIGPPIFEAWTAMFHSRTILDFDDAIFVPRVSDANRIVRYLKWFSKTKFTCGQFWRVTVCNSYLQNWARQHTQNVVLLPTTIDLDYHKPVASRLSSMRPCVGWTGSHSTVKYLELVRPVLAKLSERFDFDFVVICDVDPCFRELPNYRFIKWQIATEIADLSQMTIGIMPSFEGEWELGKAGFKAIQYSALGVVPVVSAVGPGREVVVDGETGFAIDNSEEAWLSALADLLSNPQKLDSMGKAAQRHIGAHYSVQANTTKFLSVFSES
jgi:glycosyltransferase involved in cell wall biosynthesis